MPNPFYQIYEGAALLAGAEPYYLNTTAATAFVPDLDAVPAEVWQRCQVLYSVHPWQSDRRGAVAAYLRQALALAERYDFVIAADECYAEIYSDETRHRRACCRRYRRRARTLRALRGVPQPSKRSSVPGLRSGFVAGDPALIERFLLYRTYHGSAMAVPTQPASIAAWNDDAHAAANRRLYQEKFARVLPILAPVIDVTRPAGAFYLWPEVGGDDEAFARDLYATQNLTVLPGSYLGRRSLAANPGAGRVRISLVPDVDACVGSRRAYPRVRRTSHG